MVRHRALAAPCLGVLAAIVVVILIKVQSPDGNETEVTPPADATNSLGMKLKLIRPGKFLMGSPKHEDGPLRRRGAAA